ncbi:MAG: hypothetical protein ACYSSK_11005 [Planctomycetota bacterium]
MELNDYKLELVSSNIAPWEPKNDPSRQIVVMMSGGVDSSVSAHLLREQGGDVLGVTMRIPAACRTDKRVCCGADAAYVCGQLNLPHYFVDVTEPFNELIIDRFREEYRRGRTPNPCVDCNTFLKFMLIWDLVEKEFGIRNLATGHYAEIYRGTGILPVNHGLQRDISWHGHPARESWAPSPCHIASRPQPCQGPKLFSLWDPRSSGRTLCPALSRPDQG